jgi:hypothetical protein
VCKELTGVERQVDSITRLLNDDVHQLSFQGLATAIEEEMAYIQNVSCTRDVYEVIDYSSLQQYILLQVMLHYVQLSVQNGNELNHSYLYYLETAFINSCSYITELVCQETNICLDQQFQTMRRNMMVCSVQLLTEFAELLLSDQREDTYLNIIRSVDEQIWKSVLQDSCLFVAHKVYADWCASVRASWNYSVKRSSFVEVCSAS